MLTAIFNSFTCFIKSFDSGIALSFLIGFILTALLVYLAVKFRYKTKLCVTLLTVGIFVAVFFAVLPTNWIEAGETVLYPKAHRFVSAWLYSFSVLGGGGDVSQFNSIPLGCNLKWIYYLFVYILLALAPLFTSSLILSYIGDSLARIRFFLKWRRKYYVFSELSENSLEMAKSIKRRRFELFVFCNTKNADATLCAEAKKLGSILLYKPADTLNLFSLLSKNYEFYFLSEQEEENVRLTESFILKKQKLKRHNVIINAFSQSGVNIKIIESMMSQNNDDTQKKNKHIFKIRFIDEIALFCNDLLFRNPLYDLPEGQKEISVLLIGCGWFGLRMLKTVCWCGQILGYNLKICVLDKNAKQIEDKFNSDCPEMIKAEYNIVFDNVDVESTKFEEKIKKNLDATFICVTTGTDELNISTTEKVYRIFRRQYNDYTPPIYTRVRKSVYSDNFEQSSSYFKNKNIHLFGTVASVYSTETLFNTKLECLTFATHLAYEGILENPKSNKDYQEALDKFYASEYNRRSSMAAALHLLTNLAACGIFVKGDLPTDADLAKFEKRINDETFKNNLIKNEHLHWNAYMRSEGFSGVSFETMEKYAKIIGSHKDEDAKLHPCILEWNELDVFQQKYNNAREKLSLKPKNFKQHDVLLVTKIPQIVKNANLFMEEGF